MIRAALLAIILTGCATGSPMPSNELREVMAAWRADLPLSKECRSYISDFRVRVASGSDFYDVCRKDLCDATHTSDCDESCADLSTPAAVVGPAFNLRGHRVHEALHALQLCALGVIDYAHENATIWARPNGMLGRLEK